jgi:hypothetical protein
MFGSARPRIEVFAYRGWRPLRALALIAVGIVGGFAVAERNAPTVSATAVMDCNHD